MGIDELNSLGELGVPVLVVLALILGMVAFIWFIVRETNKDRMEFTERKLYLESLGEHVKAAAATATAIMAMSDRVENLAKLNQGAYESARATMSTVTARHDEDLKKGVEVIRLDIGAVPEKVGEITGPQMNTIREELAKLEERVGKRIDDSLEKFSDTQIEHIRAEIEAFSQRLVEKLENLEQVVPEKVVQAIQPKAPPVVTPPTQPAENTPQTAEPGESAEKVGEG